MNQNISAVIIEDDDEALSYFSSILKTHFNEIEIVGTSNSVENSIKLLRHTDPELVFMDIELIDGNAFQILDTIENYDFEIIFVSAYNNYIEKSLEYYALNFITKPIQLRELSKILKRYFNLEKRLFTKQKYLLLKEFLTESKLLINTGNEHIAIFLNDIIRCEADGNYSLFTLSNKSKHLASKPLKYYESLLTEKAFFRANRSTLVNIKHISSIYKRESITLSNNEKVIISVRNKPKLSELIKHLS